MIPLSQPLAELDWIPRPKLTALRRFGIETVEDLLTHFPRRYEDRTEFAGFPREESDVADLPLRRGRENAAPAFRRLEENLRSDFAGIGRKRAEPAARAAVVQSALRAKNDRDRAAAGGLRQTAVARAAALPGASRVRSDRERRRNLGAFPSDHSDLSGDRRTVAASVPRTDPSGAGRAGRDFGRDGVAAQRSSRRAEPRAA